jgi:hypothetical protein
MMKAHAQLYRAKKLRPDSPAHVDFKSSYFASNNMLRLHSTRDKLALAVWAYYCPFDPDDKQQVLTYKQIVHRLRCQECFGLKLENARPFLSLLNRLDGNEFKNVEEFRHLVVHRREPLIEMQSVSPHHGLSYLLPLHDENAIRKFKASLKKQYPDPTLYPERLSRCKINGTIYDQRKLDGRWWAYADIEKACEKALKLIIVATSGCTNELLTREPLKSMAQNKRSPTDFLKRSEATI